MKTSHLLGLNARSRLFSYPYNPKSGKKIAASKILTDRMLRKFGIPGPKIIKKFRNPSDIVSFEWKSLPLSFALKPSRGLGGEGIVVIKKKLNEEVVAKSTEGSAKSLWLTSDKKKVNADDLKLHVLDILEGAYSLGNISDVAFIQEYVGRHKALRKYSFRGTPDIRIIVFNKVPVMAMLRLPTKESGGRANLHQGAVGVGVDISTGITTKAIWHGNIIKRKPGSKRKLHGIKIPGWDDILRIAVKCQIASGLGYLGVDIVLHPEKGPMVLELNSMPGLQIQLANLSGLKKRLERVEDLQVRDVEHGVNIGKALFSSAFTARVVQKDRQDIVGALEDIKIKGKGERVKILAKIDTGAWRTSIDKELARSLDLLRPDNVIKTKKVRSSLGKEERPIITLTYWLKGIKITTIAGVADRKSLKRKVIIGRRDLGRFLVKPEIKEESEWVIK